MAGKNKGGREAKKPKQDQNKNKRAKPLSTARESWIWPTFRGRVGPAGHAASRTRLRSRSNLARPYICLSIILKVTWNLTDR